MSSCPPCWISTILKARGSLPPVRFSSQLSQDQGSRPLITHPSQNKTARFGALSQQHKVKICLLRKGTQIIHFSQEKWVCSQPKISRKKMFSLYDLRKFAPSLSTRRFLIKLSYLRVALDVTKSCVVTTTKLGLGNSRHTHPVIWSPLLPSAD